ncbi:MAG: hypothetical protein LBD02_02635 [Christensenellaceae bacterium]|jgi:hypothetical protein|nr:hypothetical protein [Christensenellaceae bacterium]
MGGFVRYEKLSKKKKKEVNAMGRGGFGPLRPETKRLESKKLYDRKKARRFGEFPDAGSFLRAFDPSLGLN